MNITDTAFNLAQEIPSHLKIQFLQDFLEFAQPDVGPLLEMLQGYKPKEQKEYREEVLATESTADKMDRAAKDIYNATSPYETGRWGFSSCEVVGAQLEPVFPSILESVARWVHNPPNKIKAIVARLEKFTGEVSFKIEMDE
jgi:hypothetical protein